MPSLDGQVWVVTGANSGLGLVSAEALAKKGATVVMGCRDPNRAEAAAAGLTAQTPGAKLELRALDLASLKSVSAFSAEVAAAHPRIDGLLNNAGVMALPFAKTADGFEMQFGTNHLGHFALTLRLLPLLEQAERPRVVTVSSLVHHRGRIDFDNLMGERRYSAWPGYFNSKLANLLFTAELARRLAAAGKKTVAAAAHPGYSATNLQGASARASGSTLSEWTMALGNSLLAQSAEMGALPQLYAATADDVKPGDFFGPDGWFSMAGYPTRNARNARAKDEVVAAQLWERSEALTGLTFSGAR